MKHAAIKQRCLRLIKNHNRGGGTFSFKRTDKGWEIGWTEADKREVRATVADHARHVPTT